MLVNTGEENGPHCNKSLIVVPLTSDGITRRHDDVTRASVEPWDEERIYVVARSLGIMQDARIIEYTRGFDQSLRSGDGALRPSTEYPGE